MAGDPVVDDLNVRLGGSPYSIPDHLWAESQVRETLDLGAQIQRRHAAVESMFAARSVEIQERIERMTTARGVFESNALESAGLDLDRTDLAISEALEVAGSDVNQLGEHIAALALQGDRHLLEVLGLHRASVFAERLAEDYREGQTPIREIDVRDLHRFTLPGEHHGGSYRAVEVEISGSDLTPSNVVEIQFHMQQLLAWVNATDVHPPLAAAVAHSWLAMIHPFEDGNGRTARLLANIVLMKAGWPPLIIRKSDRVQYLDALSLSDSGGDILPLFDLFVGSIERVLGDLERPDLAEQLYTLDLRRRPDRRFELWWAQLSAFLDEVRMALRAEAWDLVRTEVPEPSTLHLLEHHDKTGNMWLAKVHGPDGQDLVLRLAPMGADLAASCSFDDHWPSLRVSVRDDRPGAAHKWRDAWEVEGFTTDEVIAKPPLTTAACITVRGGGTAAELTPREAAHVVAGQIMAAFGS